jgi:hypothetical protein
MFSASAVQCENTTFVCGLQYMCVFMYICMYAYIYIYIYIYIYMNDRCGRCHCIAIIEFLYMHIRLYG